MSVRISSGTASLIVAVMVFAGCGRQAPPKPAGPAGGRKPESAPAQPAPPRPAAPTQPAPAPTSSQPTAPAPAAPAETGQLRRVRVLVSGRVQGVGFRAFTNSEARRIGVTGWVRNLRDGRVEAIVEGPSAKVDELLQAMRTGPAGANVEGTAVVEGTHTGEFKDFRVTY